MAARANVRKMRVKRTNRDIGERIREK